MARDKKIQDYDLAYDILRYYVDCVLKLSYRNVHYVGRERIPQDGAIIYAPNHTNALMDALVILAMDRSAKVFVARSADPKLTDPIVEMCQEKNVPLVEVATMEELGKACQIEVGAAVAALLKA